MPADSRTVASGRHLHSAQGIQLAASTAAQAQGSKDLRGNVFPLTKRFMRLIVLNQLLPSQSGPRWHLQRRAQGGFLPPLCRQHHSSHCRFGVNGSICLSFLRTSCSLLPCLPAGLQHHSVDGRNGARILRLIWLPGHQLLCHFQPVCPLLKIIFLVSVLFLHAHIAVLFSCGSIQDLQYLVDTAHKHGITVLLDVVRRCRRSDFFLAQLTSL